MFTLKAWALPRKSAIFISSAFASWDSGEVAATGGFSSEIAAEGKASPAQRKRASDARRRIIGCYLFGSLVRDSTTIIAGLRRGSRRLPDWPAPLSNGERISLTRRYSWTARFGP